MPSSSVPAVPRSSSHLSSGCLVLFGLPFLAGGLAIVGLFSFLLINAVRARFWVAHPCTIEAAHLDSSSDSEGTTHRAKSTYHWQWEGRAYYSDQVTFWSGADNIGSFQTRTAAELAAAEGNPGGYRCWVNPSHPAEAVLHRGLRWEMLLFLFPFVLLFPGFGAIAVFYPFFSRKTREADGVARQAHPDDPSRWRSDWAAGYIEDRGGWREPGVRFIIFWFLLWCAVECAAMFLTDHSWEKGRVIFTAVFAGLFLLVAWRTWRRAMATRRLGVPRFVPDTWRMVPGEPLTGMIALPQPLRDYRNITAKLKVWGREKGEESSRVFAKTEAELEAHPSGLVIRVHLPDAPPATPPGSTDSFTWTLKLKAPADALYACFELPVVPGNTPSAE